MLSDEVDITKQYGKVSNRINIDLLYAKED